MLLEVFSDLKNTSGLRELVWVVAPRHMQRLAEVENLLKQQKKSYQPLSAIKNSHRTADIILVDSIGELAGLYQLLGWLTLIIGFPFFLVYSLITGRYRRGLAQNILRSTKRSMRRQAGGPERLRRPRRASPESRPCWSKRLLIIWTPDY